MANPNVDIATVKKLLKLVDAHGLDELFVEEGDLAISVRGAGTHVVSAPPAAVRIPAAAGHSQPQVAPLPAAPAEMDHDIVDITAPLVGVFYRTPSPDTPPFVEVGDHVEVGSEVGLIEAMKVFSPIPSEVAGEVVETPAEDAKLVRQGEVLVRVRRSEA